MDLYIAGHGFMARTEPTVTVPAKFTLVFYCKEDKPFDSHWEADVINGAALGGQYAPRHGTDDWQVTSVAAGSTCPNHLLTRPGGIALVKPFKDFNEIDTAVASGVKVTNVVDKDSLCIKKKGSHDSTYINGRSHTYLGHLLTALALAVPGGATVHWCACRSPMADWDEIDEQSASMPAVRK